MHDSLIAPTDSPDSTPKAGHWDYADWQALPVRALKSYTLGAVCWGLFWGFIFALSTGIISSTKIDGHAVPAMLGLAVCVASIVLLIIRARHIWKHTQWKLDADGFHIRRGRWWKKETLMPLSRVQHMDIERGPIERRYALASLVIHTAGTRTQALRLAGFEETTATHVRDVLVPRQHAPASQDTPEYMQTQAVLTHNETSDVQAGR